MKITDLIFIAVFMIGLFSCKQTEIKFDKELWSKSTDGFYIYREKMIDDLMANKLEKGMSYKSVIDLLGKPANFGNMDSNSIGY